MTNKANYGEEEVFVCLIKRFDGCWGVFMYPMACRCHGSYNEIKTIPISFSLFHAFFHISRGLPLRIGLSTCGTVYVPTFAEYVRYCVRTYCIVCLGSSLYYILYINVYIYILRCILSWIYIYIYTHIHIYIYIYIRQYTYNIHINSIID